MAFLFKHRGADGSLDLTTTKGILGIYAFIGLLLFLGVSATLSAILKWRSGGAISLEPSRGWLDVLDTVATIVLVWNGINVAGMVGKRATANAEVMTVAARQISGVAATPPAVPGKNLPRNSAPTETVADSSIPQDGRTTARDDPGRGLDDDGNRL